MLISLDTHIRVGGAIGSGLQKTECPKLTGSIDRNCIAASLLMHLTPKSSAYIANSWIWVADHDLDVITQDQIDIYSARGVLIESQGPSWLYGTASEHNVMYQYQFSEAKNIVLGMIQTESPYFQTTPKAPLPFDIASSPFPNDPTFSNCPSDSITCAVAWAVRIIDSSTVYVPSAGRCSFKDRYAVAHTFQVYTVSSLNIAKSVSRAKAIRIEVSKLKIAITSGSTTLLRKEL